MPEYIYISSGVTSTGINIKYNTMYVLSGGTAIDTTANASGLVFVDTDGKAFTTVVNSGGLLTLFSLGVASDTTVNSGGSLCIWNNAMASGVTVNPGGILEIKYAGGSAIQVRENGGCVLDSYDAISYVPGSFSGLALDAQATVHSGTVATRTILNSGGLLAVFSSGLAKQTTVNSGGQVLVFSGGVASDTIVYDYCIAYGGSMTSTTVNSGGSMDVSSEGRANEIEVNPGGALSVNRGCTALQIKENGGYVYCSDEAEYTFLPNVLSGAVLNGDATVHSLTTIKETTVNARLDIYSGGIVSNAVAAGSSAWICVYSGGIADGNTVNSGGIQVFSGGAVDHTTVNEKGYLDLQMQSATADNTTVNGGVFRVANSATADHTTVNLGGIVVYNNGIANNTVISGGKLYLTNATANSTTLYDGAVSVSSGGTANSTFVSGGVMDLLSGGTANVVKVYGGTVNVFADGTAAGVSALGGTVNVSAGAVLNSASAQDGRIRVYSGGTAVANRATRTGRVLAVNGGSLLSCVALTSGRVELEGGSALATEVAAAGIMLVEGAPHSVGIEGTYGIASNTRIHLGAVASVGSGGAMVDTVVGYSSASLNPREPMIDLPSILLQRAGLYVNSSGVATGVTASKGAIVAVGLQGLLASAKLSSGATAQVLAGGSARTLNVLRGGSATIAGSATDLRIASAAKAVIGSGGSAATVAVSTGGLLRADAGAKLSGVSVASGGIVTGIFAGLSAQAVTLADGILDFDISALGADDICVEQLNTAFAGAYSCTLTVGDAQAFGVYRLAGDAAGFDKTITVQNASGEALGTLTVGGGKTTVGDYECTLTLSNDNLLSVRVRAVGGVDLTGDLTSEFTLTDDMVASSVNVHTSDGRLVVSSGAVANHTTAYEKGTLAVSEGGAADNTLVSRGLFTVFRGTADYTTISDYGSMSVISGTVDHTTVTGLCDLDLRCDATANNTTLSGGIMYITSGSTASNTTVVSSGRVYLGLGTMEHTTLDEEGRLQVGRSGIVNETVINELGKLIVEGGTADNTTINHGAMYLSKGAVADNTKAHGGLMSISDEAVANHTTVSNCDVYVYNGGTIIDTIVSTGRLYISSGGTISGTIFSSGGLFISGGTAVDTVVSSGNIFVKGGRLVDTVISGGSHLVISSGGKVTGRLTIGNGVTVSAEEGSILDFDLTRTSAGAEALVNDISRITGTPLYTLTVDDAQAFGVYRLAGDAAGFDKTITVQNASGEALGTLTVGGTTAIGATDYTLALGGDNLLSVTVGTATPEPVVFPPYLTGDFNGDGADMLAVQKDGAVTVYMNGEPWGLGLTLDPGWGVVGTGDFSGDGLDDFLRVNGEGYVVGEMSNGNGTFTPQVLNLKNPGWNILGTGDFNGNGSDDILIANPTGASETVGLLGYWESGVTWTLINGYSPEWECVSTGDFNGDGKCDMLWRNSFIGEGDLTYNAYCTWIVDNPVDWRMVSVANPDEWNFLCSGDFDGNGSHDIAMINDVGVVGIWGVNDGYLNSWSILSAVTSEWQLAGVADFNADGTDDIAWSNTDTGLTGYWQINDKTLTAWANLATL